MNNEDFELIFRNSRSMKPFLEFYSNAEECYLDYANRMTDKFSKPATACECCGGSSDKKKYSADWKILYQNNESKRRNWLNLIFAFFGHITVTKTIKYFFTAHSICRKCIFLLKMKRMFFGPLRQAAILLSALPKILAIAGLLALFIIIGAGERDLRLISEVCFLWIVSIAAIPIFSFIRRVIEMWLTPSFIRVIARSPVLFDGFSVNTKR